MTNGQHIPRTILFVTGLSGAGSTTALGHLEDMGFETFTNTPMDQIKSTAESSDSLQSRLAFSVNARTRGFTSEKLLELKSSFSKNAGWDAKIIYLFCDEEEIKKRYSEKSRPHPIAPNASVETGLKQELKILGDVVEYADLSIDTTETNTYGLRDMLKQYVSDDSNGGISVRVVSFSYKRGGVPRDANYVEDVRVLENPYWDENLRELTGLDSRIQDFIMKDENFSKLLNGSIERLKTLLPIHQEKGKPYFMVAVGCTGGKHRSVFTAEKISTALNEKGFKASVSHRDLGLE